jgi:hypothetical protein
VKFEQFWNDETLSLSSVREFDIQYFLPPAELAPFINVFFVFRCDSELVRDVLPASAGLVMYFLAGHGEARFADGNIQRSYPVSLIGPSSTAMQYIVKGPHHSFGFTFNPGGYTALTGQTATKSLNKLLDAKWVLGETFADVLALVLAIDQQHDHPERNAKLVELLSQFLIGRFKPIKPGPTAALAAFFDAVGGNLNVDLNELYPKLPVAPRQMQRLCKEYLGSPPKYLIRKFRAIRAAMLLSDPDCSEETRDFVLGHFYDQSHMIREISLFNGRTPKYLTGNNAPLLKMWLDSTKQPEMRGIYTNTTYIPQPKQG